MKKQHQKEGEDKSANGQGSFMGFFRGLESLLNTVITLEEGAQEKKYEGEASDPSGRLKTGFSLSVKTIGAATTPSAESARVVTRKPEVEAEPEPFVDFFNEQDHVRIIAELPGIEEENIHTEIHGDILILSISGNRRAYSKEIVLPEGTDVGTLTRKYTNGILEIRMDKTHHG
ncbi:hypothetical protein KDH_60930 [Dictyobacter sp. S3.2.2.5]|uniref:SHSP domain-containing protein n=1 Tax=Dictyobacter halimunensis TaxID=3026934 RepID=A0ABQ6FY96_9CHLR|nr:hypothetical protein KDH_60930 [Dictyobacter sp. S3.2.2.5]